MYHPVINLASAKSAWRGLDIYRAGKVLTCEKAEGNWFEGTVQGSAEQPHHVRLSLDHPRSSTCDCPHAKNRAVICKHKVALFFKAVPNAERDFLREVELEEFLYNAALKREAEERHREIVSYVSKLTKAQLQQELINTLEELDSRDQYSRW